ncbi:cupin domain-containing protein [Sphingobium sp.]|uniref:cupin domain-containing protein n=1 Tax=Sphingobium sp. TaxID=1912891 RepID=UPI0028BDF02B|nr:cupin domain-containing protein [Sphingobium sp.]
MNGSPPPIRRVVTGHDAGGKAVVWQDGAASNRTSPFRGTTATVIWATDSSPADYGIDQDGANLASGVAPPPNGTRFAILEFEPGHAMHGLHSTDTVDYVICLAGEIDLDLDDETVKLRTGDVVVQRGTNHAWVNRGGELARIAAVLIDGAPKRTVSVSGTDEVH